MYDPSPPLCCLVARIPAFGNVVPVAAIRPISSRSFPCCALEFPLIWAVYQTPSFLTSFPFIQAASKQASKTVTGVLLDLRLELRLRVHMESRCMDRSN